MATEKIAVRLKRKEHFDESQQCSIFQGQTPASIYNLVVEHEYEIATAHNDASSQLLKSTLAELDSVIKRVIELKKSQLDPKIIADEISELRERGAVLFITMKQLNRLAKLRMNCIREKTQEVKCKVDKAAQKLNCLKSEILQSKRKADFYLQSSPEDEQIDLIPLEKFYEEAPESVSKPDITKNDAHQLKISRLEWELHQRKSILENCLKVKEEYHALKNEIEQNQSNHDFLIPLISNALIAVKPIQQHLNLPSQTVTEIGKLTNLLPHPLYLLYIHSSSSAKVSNFGMNVEIIGEEEDVDSFEIASVQMDDSGESDNESSAEKERSQEEVHRKKKSRNEVRQENIKRLFLVHPLCVSLNFEFGDDRCISILFKYFPNLQMVTVTIKLAAPTAYNTLSCGTLISPETILDEIFPNDRGTDVPNLVSRKLLNLLNAEFNYMDHGLAYHWAHRLCGLTYDSTCNSAKRNDVSISHSDMFETFRAIQTRVTNRLDLCFHVKDLEKCVIPYSIPGIKTCLPVKSRCNFDSWECITWMQYKELAFTNPMVTDGCATEQDIFYLLKFSNKNAKLTAAVIIKTNYPVIRPIYSLQVDYMRMVKTASDNNEIRDMEGELNIFHADLIPRLNKEVDVLSAQIHQLMVLFDIYLECMYPEEYEKTKPFVFSFWGRNRKLPYKFEHHANGGVFGQRLQIAIEKTDD